MISAPDEKLDVSNIPRSAAAASDLGHVGESNWWQAWFDGAAAPNPGRIGIGVVLVSPDGARREHADRPSANGCNNEAELQALIVALELALASGARRMRIRGDSDLAVRALLNPVESLTLTVPRLLSLIERIRALARQFEAIDCAWVPRHRNGDADRLSRQALGLPDKPAVVPGKKRRSRRRSSR